ncbi:dynein heavy chain 7, axonemal [Caerostris extrusa]|uniref:Dynein heavy chain 7, axonemal n=1 Tax=Caerostris extrusa TaxID=172846 RepID=A0AAV4XMH7_CAEEX|nr:dynein heavy chain 7, axonemal [Caerostris extrusa]
MSKLEKRRKGIFGPPFGKRCVIFIDDLNMPAVEIYGAQPPIELLRQYFDHGMWYEKKEKSVIHLVDTQFIAAMGLPGGARNNITPRLLRHFGVIGVNAFSSPTMNSIFSSVMSIHFKNNHFPAEALLTAEAVVSTTAEIYTAVTAHLLPTPAKSHYSFNLRDFARVIHGCCLLRKESMEKKKILIRLWVHEIYRVFYDRLTDPEDCNWLFEQIRVTTELEFKENFNSLFRHICTSKEGKVLEDDMRNLMFGTYMNYEESPADRLYDEMDSIETFETIADKCLSEYNSFSKSPLDMVIFRRLSEVKGLFQVRLGAPVQTVSHPVHAGRERAAGGRGWKRQTVRHEARVLHHRTVALPAGNNEELRPHRVERRHQTCHEVCGGRGQRDGVFGDRHTDQGRKFFGGHRQPAKLWRSRAPLVEKRGRRRPVAPGSLLVLREAVEREHAHHHRHEPHRQRLPRQAAPVPSLINCCTIDWFQTWPEDALERVAEHSFQDMELKIAMRKNAVVICKYFHVRSQELSKV